MFRGPLTNHFIDYATHSKILYDHLLDEVIGRQEINRFAQISL
jgi:hypothetical protein